MSDAHMEITLITLLQESISNPAGSRELLPLGYHSTKVVWELNIKLYLTHWYKVMRKL